MMIIGNRERESAPTTFTISKAVDTVGSAAVNSADLEALILKTVEDAVASIGDAAVSDTALDVLQQKVTALEAVNTSQDGKITALEGKAYTVADTAWTACTMSAGITSTLWARVWKGNVIFKSGTSTGANFLTGALADFTKSTQIAILPASIPKPPARFHVPISTYQTASKSAYGTGLFFVNNTTGSIEVLPTTAPMDGFWPQGISYAVGAAWT